VLYQVVRDHFETFRALAAGLRDGEGLPRFVEQAAFARSAPASLGYRLAMWRCGDLAKAIPRLLGPDRRVSSSHDHKIAKSHDSQSCNTYTGAGRRPRPPPT